MFDDDKSGGGLGLNVPALGAVGEVMLILFVTVVMTMSVKAQLIHSRAFGSSRGEETPEIGLEVTVGPGEVILVDGESLELEAMFARAKELAGEEKVQVRMHINGDPELFYNVRYGLRGQGCSYIEAPPLNPAARKGVKK